MTSAPVDLEPRGWRVSGHARERAKELGFDLLEVLATAKDPEQSYEQAQRGHGQWMHQRGDIAVAIHKPSQTVLTVLLRTADDWTHGIDKRQREQEKAPEPAPCFIAKPKTRPVVVWNLNEAKQMLEQGYRIEQVARMTGYDIEVLEELNVE